jgi:hypothetical protein
MAPPAPAATITSAEMASVRNNFRIGARLSLQQSSFMMRQPTMQL